MRGAGGGGREQDNILRLWAKPGQFSSAPLVSVLRKGPVDVDYERARQPLENFWNVTHSYLLPSLARYSPHHLPWQILVRRLGPNPEGKTYRSYMLACARKPSEYEAFVAGAGLRLKTSLHVAARDGSIASLLESGGQTQLLSAVCFPAQLHVLS